MLAACGQKKEIPYEVAKNYFVRNDVTEPIPAKIGSLDEFERYFGMAKDHASEMKKILFLHGF